MEPYKEVGNKILVKIIFETKRYSESIVRTGFGRR